MINSIHSRTARDTIVNPAGMIRLELLRTSSKLLKESLSADASEIAAIKQELALLEQGKLHIHHSGKRYCFCAVPDAALSDDTVHEEGITRDPKRIHDLARRAYLQQRIKIIELNSHRLRKVLASCDEAQYEASLCRRLERYAKAGLDLCRILFTKEQNEWLDASYSPNPYYKESLKYKTEHGIPVRSKSEARLGSFFELVGLPFRSDDLVEIHADFGMDFDDRPFKEKYFADFKVPNLCGGITIHEHLGAMHKSDYPDASLKRLNDYHNFTAIELPGRPVRPEEFTWSFEPELFSEDALRKLVKRILLPDLR